MTTACSLFARDRAFVEAVPWLPNGLNVGYHEHPIQYDDVLECAAFWCLDVDGKPVRVVKRVPLRIEVHVHRMTEEQLEVGCRELLQVGYVEPKSFGDVPAHTVDVKGMRYRIPVPDYFERVLRGVDREGVMVANAFILSQWCR